MTAEDILLILLVAIPFGVVGLILFYLLGFLKGSFK